MENIIRSVKVNDILKYYGLHYLDISNFNQMG